MISFIIKLIIVFIGVELLVRFIVEPLLEGKHKKVAKSSSPKLDPTFKLATETMYDGGKPHILEGTNNATKDENISKDEVKY